MAMTGGNPAPTVVVGAILVVVGWAARRRLLMTRRVRRVE
jgi:hypothetical protein